MVTRQVKNMFATLRTLGNYGSITFQTTTILTDAQIKALPTTDVTIIDAPNVGKYIIPEFILLICDTRAGVYTNIDPDDGFITVRASTGQVFFGGILNSTTTTPNVSQINSFLGATNINTAALPKSAAIVDYGGGSYEFTTNIQSFNLELDPVPLVIKGYNNAAGNFTGGNVANSLKVCVTYYVFDISTGTFETVSGI